MPKRESKERRYQKALEFIVANSLHQDAWYVRTARTALGEDHPYNKEDKLKLVPKSDMN
jgi:hypothetical protein